MILITGGAGFIGAHLVRHWLHSTDEAVVVVDALTYAGSLDNLRDCLGSPRLTFVQQNILEQDAMRALLTEHRPHAVLHLAAETHVDRAIAHAERFVHTNVVGTQRLLDATRQHWQTLSGTAQQQFRFVQVSTDEVYGALGPMDAPFLETHPCRPRNPYAASKAAADHLADACHHTHGLPVIVTHCSNNYGPNQHPEKLIPRMIRAALAGEPLPVYGSGQQVRDWLHVDDHCRALLRLLEAGVPGQHYNIGGQQERTNIQVVQLICKQLDRLHPRADGQSHAQHIQHVTDRPGHDWRYAIDSRKIQQLGWRAVVDFEAGLEQLIDRVEQRST